MSRSERFLSTVLALVVLVVIGVSLFSRKPSAVIVKKTPPSPRDIGTYACGGSGFETIITDAGYRQLHLMATVGPSPVTTDFELNSEGDEFCNVTERDITDIEILITMGILRTSGNSPVTIGIRYGLCSDCVGKPFPQAVDSDVLPPPEMIYGYNAPAVTETLALGNIIALVEPGACFVVMAKVLTSGGGLTGVLVTSGSIEFSY